MKIRYYFRFWHDLRRMRKRFLEINPNCRCIGISEMVKIDKAAPGCDADGDVWIDGSVHRYFNLCLGVVEKAGTVYDAPNLHLLLRKKPQP